MLVVFRVRYCSTAAPSSGRKCPPSSLYSSSVALSSSVLTLVCTSPRSRRLINASIRASSSSLVRTGSSSRLITSMA